MKGRRLEPFYRAVCNGAPAIGCDWSSEGSSYRALRIRAENHAVIRCHEVVVSNVNDGLVLDGRRKP
jgi:hypothetical protein